MFYYSFPIGPHFFDKIKVLNLDLKLCPHQDLTQTSFPTKFQNFWMDYLRDISILVYRRFFMDIVLCMNILESLYLGGSLAKSSDALLAN